MTFAMLVGYVRGYIAGREGQRIDPDEHYSYAFYCGLSDGAVDLPRYGDSVMVPRRGPQLKSFVRRDARESLRWSITTVGRLYRDARNPHE